VGADKTCTTGDKYAHKGSLRVEVRLLKQDSVDEAVKRSHSRLYLLSQGIRPVAKSSTAQRISLERT
jgi:hypothetical protein